MGVGFLAFNIRSIRNLSLSSLLVPHQSYDRSSAKASNSSLVRRSNKASFEEAV